MYSKGYSTDKITIPPEYDGNALASDGQINENGADDGAHTDRDITDTERYNVPTAGGTSSLLDGIGTEDIILIAAVAAIFLFGEKNSLTAIAVAVAAILI